MSSKFQRSMEEIHASRDLIDRTKRQVRLAAETKPKAAVFPLWRMAAAAAAVLVVVVCAVLFWNAAQAPVFAVLPTAEQAAPGGQLGLLDPQRRNVSAGEFDRVFGTSLEHLDPQDFSGWLIRSPEGEAAMGEASFAYKGCTVRVSLGGGLLPGDLTGVPARELSGEKVHLARRGESGPLLAGFDRDGMECLATGAELEPQAFLEAVSELAAGMKGERE